MNPSQDFIKAPCVYYDKCGGCDLQHLSYQSQLQFKEKIVFDALTKTAQIKNILILPIKSSPKEFHYRSRIQLHINKKGEVGYYQKKSHDIVDIETCLIADEKINNQIKNYKIQKSQNPFVTTIAKEETIELKIDESPGFCQINKDQNDFLVDCVLDFLKLQKTDRIFDLYCGSGNFTFPISQIASKVSAIEIEKEAINFAKSKSQKENVTNIIWHQGDVRKHLNELKKKNIRCDSIVVDPPRRGLTEDLKSILQFKAQKIIYVSCEPLTFAMDAKELIQFGYQLEKCQPIDMFPQTKHVELVGLFRLCDQ